MGSVTPGTGGTLKSTTIENMLFEALTLGTNWENDITKNPTGESKITLTLDLAAKRMNAGFTFSLTRERTATGATSFPVKTQLVNTGYTAGANGSIVSTNIYAAIVELCEQIQARDIDPNKNPQNLNTVTSLSYDSESLTAQGSCTLVLDYAVASNGDVVSKAKTYLIDV